MKKMYYVALILLLAGCRAIKPPSMAPVVPVANDKPAIEEPVKKVPEILGNIYFKFDSYEITNKKEIDELIEIALNNNIKIRLNGHACRIGTDNYNMTLSFRRIINIYNILIENGIRKEIIRYTAYGETKTLGEELKWDRRVEMVLE